MRTQEQMEATERHITMLKKMRQEEILVKIQNLVEDYKQKAKWLAKSAEASEEYHRKGDFAGVLVQAHDWERYGENMTTAAEEIKKLQSDLALLRSL